ncbi:MAG: hypothetical protein GWN18_10460, partial [Thermoplasmata archaeon]|nr:hypothetical protein [Thermoplasmata archaeon]NIS12469.1 hypothetical protein [Thermoplasmata archaeon]NIS20388.1 hypothetical protein [Thermoplasmata archaeon]NIT77734.1 hypothetical protein [Thermoplasmata archaeon]NIU49475.1 hypothetical protein [Thermoplasmata archaeon]
EVPTEGDSVAIEVRIVNEGTSATGPLDVELRDTDGTVLANASVDDPVDPGASTTVTLEWTAVE